MLNQKELEDFLKSQGWYLQMSLRNQTRYAYAKRRVGNRVVGRYLKTERQLDQLTPEYILKRITL